MSARKATDAVSRISKNSVDSAILAAERVDEVTFYRNVGMRNPSRTRFLLAKGKSYSIKAIFVHALRDEGCIFCSTDFHGADALKRAHQLGFSVFHRKP